MGFSATNAEDTIIQLSTDADLRSSSGLDPDIFDVILSSNLRKFSINPYLLVTSHVPRVGLAPVRHMTKARCSMSSLVNSGPSYCVFVSFLMDEYLRRTNRSLKKRVLLCPEHEQWYCVLVLSVTLPA